MKPERAKYLLNHKTEIYSPVGKFSFQMKTIECGDIRKHMTGEEINYVNRIWQSLPGSSSFYTTLLRIAAGDYDKLEEPTP